MEKRRNRKRRNVREGTEKRNGATNKSQPVHVVEQQQQQEEEQQEERRKKNIPPPFALQVSGQLFAHSSPGIELDSIN